VVFTLVLGNFTVPVFGYGQEMEHLNPQQTNSLEALELRWNGQKQGEQSPYNRLATLERKAALNPPKGVSLEYRLAQLRAIQQVQATLAQQNEANRLYNQAIDAADARDWSKVEALYKAALKAYPGMVMAANNLGVLYETQNRYPEAATLYEDTIQAAPLEPILHRNLGVVQEHLGNIEQALLAFKVYLALSQQPDPPIQSIIDNYEANKTMTQSSNDYFRVVTDASNGRQLIWPMYLTPIPVYIDLTSADQIPFVPLVKDSYEQWENVTQKRLTFKQVMIPEQAYITIYLTQGPLQASYQDVGHANFDVKWDKKDRLTRMQVNIRINTGEPDDPLPLEQKQLLVSRHILHELGHAIGIWGHSTNPEDVMYTHPIVSLPSERDIATVRKLYQLDYQTNGFNKGF